MCIEPLVSVVIPIYNVERYLNVCVESVLKQTYTNLEVILVDDGSTDSCPALCDEYTEKDRRVVVYHKANGGLSDARNFGIEQSNGKYITLVDSDDYVESDYVEYLLILIMKHAVKMAIAQHTVHYNNGSRKRNLRNGDECISTERCLKQLLYHDCIDTAAWGKMYHRSLFDTVRYPKGKIFEDIGTTYALILQCDRIAVGNESKYNYVFHNNSIVNSTFNLSKMDLIEMTDKMAAEVQTRYPQLKAAALRRQVYSRLSTLNQMLDVKGYDKEREEILKYLDSYKWKVIGNSRTPCRDKLALILLSINYSLYKSIWLFYRKWIMTKHV